VAPLLDSGEAAGVHPLAIPPPAAWTPASGVRARALESGAREIDGDATRGAAQIMSPKMTADIGDLVTLHLDMTVAQGRACLGVLNGTKTGWLVSPDRPRTDVTFHEDDSRGFYVVSANCNDADTGNAPTRLTLFGGSYTIDPAMLYTDRLMSAVGAKPADPDDLDVAGAMPGLLTVPPDLKVTRTMLKAPAEPMAPSAMAFQSPIVRASGAGWIVSGRAESAYSYLLQSKPISLDTNTRLIITGTIEQGGITFGLLSRGAWAGQVTVKEAGPFTVVIAAPRSGSFSVVAANALPLSLDTSITISRLGVLHVR
jgi:hypothetical protein